MNKLLEDNSYAQPLLFNGAKTETEFSGQQVESKFGCTQKSKPQDSGYTIIESLVAMIVVSVLMIAIAPVMAFSVATRVQARRIEVATQAAKTYIDALRVGAIKSTDTRFPAEDDANVPAAPTSPDPLYCVNLDETAGCAGSKEFLVQGVRPTGNNPTNTGYSLIVRVYRADAPFGSLTTGQQSVANSGIGNPKAPLVEMKTEIPPTTKGASAYRSLCDRTNGCK